MKPTTPAKRKVGRPKLETPSEYAPVRAIGRVPDDVWNGFKADADRDGQSFTQWVIAALTAHSRRSRKKIKQPVS